MILLALTAALSCPAPILTNVTLRDKLDAVVFHTGRRTCGRRYSNLPCLIQVEKTPNGDGSAHYHHTCGEKRDMTQGSGK